MAGNDECPRAEKDQPHRRRQHLLHPSHAERFTFVQRLTNGRSSMKSKKASSRVTSANQETAATARAARRSTKRKGDRECRHRECRPAPVSENGLAGDPGPHPRQRSAAAGQAGFPVRYVQIRRL
jgi:hypothetical protein